MEACGGVVVRCGGVCMLVCVCVRACVHVLYCVMFPYQAEQLPEQLKGDADLAAAGPSEERRHGEAGADRAEVVLWVHCTAIRQVRTCRAQVP